MQLRAIVIDDDEACRSLLAQVLRQRGYEVICLPDPTACPLYENSACSCPEEAVCGDFLLTDNRMPGMSGLELIARQVQGGCKGNVGNKAVLSGTWSGGELQQAQMLGCKVFDKPYQTEEIENWLDAQEKVIPANRKLIDFV
jgi:CheY-like chemotaxis protein